MYIVFFICVLSVLLAFLSSKKYLKNGLELSFILLALFFSIRYGYGNDYMGYLDIFNGFSGFSTFGDLFDYYNADGNIYISEIGWGILNYIFQPLGFPVLVAFLTCFEYFIYYRIIKIYVPQEYYWLAVFTFAFTPQILLLQLSMMRQTLSIVLIMLATHLGISKKRVYASICLLVAVLVHRSALFVLPFFIVVFFYKSISKYSTFILIFIFIALFISRDYLSGLYLNSFDNELLTGYSHYAARMDSHEVRLGVGFLISFIPFFLFIRYIWLKGNNTIIKTFVFLAALSYALSPISYIEGLLGRFAYYFVVFAIVAIPFSYFSIKKKLYRIALVGVYILITLYTYFAFMINPIWVKSYSVYHTVFGL